MSDLKNSQFEENKNMIPVIGNVISSIESFYNNSFSLPNVAITYNNQIVKLKQICKRNNIDFETSNLMKLAYRYLTKLLKDAQYKLMDFTTLTNSIYKKSNDVSENKDIIYLYKEGKDILESYKQIDSSIFFFDIEKDMQVALDSDISYFKNIGIQGGYDIYNCKFDIIKLYNNELEEFGYKKRVSILNNDNLNDKNIRINSLNEIVYKLSLKIEEKFISCPFIKNAILFDIHDYQNNANICLSVDDITSFNEILNILNNYDLLNNLHDKIGLYIVYQSKANEFNKYDLLLKFKNELEQLGLENEFNLLNEKIDKKLYCKNLANDNHDKDKILYIEESEQKTK